MAGVVLEVIACGVEVGLQLVVVPGLEAAVGLPVVREAVGVLGAGHC